MIALSLFAASGVHAAALFIAMSLGALRKGNALRSGLIFGLTPCLACEYIVIEGPLTDRGMIRCASPHQVTDYETLQQEVVPHFGQH